MKKTIYPCLWFNGNALEAANFYCSVFENSLITDQNALVVNFESSGQRFLCLNGGPDFSINPSISFYVVCETIEELEKYWKNLTEGGMEMMPLDKYPWSEKYAWVQDKFGISWQLSLGMMGDVGQKFTPTLMFTGFQAGKAEEAVAFYTSVFHPSSTIGIMRYGPEDGDVEGNIKHAQFKLGDYVMMAMDSSLSHGFEFNEGISLVVECDTQEEIDRSWDSLTEGGSEGHCGWLKDQFGVSWQIVPSILGQLMSNPERSKKVMEAFMKMKKFEIGKLLEV